MRAKGCRLCRARSGVYADTRMTLGESLKVRESHFNQAATITVHETVQKVAATCSEPSQADEAAHEKTLENDDSPAFPLCSKYTREDSKKFEKQREGVSSGPRYAPGYAFECQWQQVRQLILDCPDLLPETRQSLIAQGDHAAVLVHGAASREIQQHHQGTE